MKKIFVPQLCLLGLLMIGSTAANADFVIDNNNNYYTTLPLGTLTSTPQDFVFTTPPSVATTDNTKFPYIPNYANVPSVFGYIQISKTPGIDSILNMSITSLTSGWQFNPNPNGDGVTKFGLEDANANWVGTFLDNGHGGFGLYAGDGSSRNADVLLQTVFSSGTPSNDYVLVFESDVLNASANPLPVTSFRLTGSLTPAAVPVPAAAWLMLSGILGVMGMGKAKRKAALTA